MRRASPQLCDRVRGLVSLESDGELSSLEEAVVDAHVRDCCDCREYRAHVVALTSALRSAEPERLTRPVRLPARRSVRAQLRARPAAAGAALLVGLVTLVAQPAVDRSRWLEHRATPPPPTIFVSRGQLEYEQTLIRLSEPGSPVAPDQPALVDPPGPPLY